MTGPGRIIQYKQNNVSTKNQGENFRAKQRTQVNLGKYWKNNFFTNRFNTGKNCLFFLKIRNIESKLNTGSYTFLMAQTRSKQSFIWEEWLKRGHRRISGNILMACFVLAKLIFKKYWCLSGAHCPSEFIQNNLQEMFLPYQVLSLWVWFHQNSSSIVYILIARLPQILQFAVSK